jgi:hypothetical protein
LTGSSARIRLTIERAPLRLSKTRRTAEAADAGEDALRAARQQALRWPIITACRTAPTSPLRYARNGCPPNEYRVVEVFDDIPRLVHIE